MTGHVAGRPAELVGLLVDVENLPALAPALEAWLSAYLAAGGVRLHVLSDDGWVLERIGSGEPSGLGQGLAGGTPLTRTDASGVAWTLVPVRDDSGAVIGVLEVGPALATTAGAGASPAAAAELVGPLLATARRCRAVAARLESARRFAERAIFAQEAERTRLAREIHDGVSQRLAGLGFHLSAAASLCGAGDPGARASVSEALAAARRLADLAGAETRAAISYLRPAVLDDLGLRAALASFGREMSRTPGGPEVNVSVAGEDDRELPGHLQTALYRIAQECLRNAVRHARASVVEVHLDCGTTQVCLTVEDDGVGFVLDGDRAAGGRPDSFGLRGVRERAGLLGGTVELASDPGRGTTIRVDIPRSSPDGP